MCYIDGGPKTCQFAMPLDWPSPSVLAAARDRRTERVMNGAVVDLGNLKYLYTLRQKSSCAYDVCVLYVTDILRLFDDCMKFINGGIGRFLLLLTSERCRNIHSVGS